MLSAETIVQSLASGLLMGLLYGLIAVGLALIFGLMDVVNFAHGEFLMTAMYATFGLAVLVGLDPLLSAPLVAAALFVFAILMQGLAQFLFTPDYRSIANSWLGGKTLSVGDIFLPVPQLAGAVVSIATFGLLYFVINRTDFGRALEATREDAGARPKSVRLM